MNVVAVGLFQFFGVIALACIALGILAALIFTTTGRYIGAVLIAMAVLIVVKVTNPPTPAAQVPVAAAPAQKFTFTPVASAPAQKFTFTPVASAPAQKFTFTPAASWTVAGKQFVTVTHATDSINSLASLCGISLYDFRTLNGIPQERAEWGVVYQCQAPAPVVATTHMIDPKKPWLNDPVVRSAETDIQVLADAKRLHVHFIPDDLDARIKWTGQPQCDATLAQHVADLKVGYCN